MAHYRILWSRLSVYRRVFLVLVFVGTLVAAVATLGWVQQANYVTLYTNLVPAEAGEIVDVLSAMDVPYRISVDGTAILVPGREAQLARLKLAAQGYSRDGSGDRLLTERRSGAAGSRLSFAQLELCHSVEDHLEAKAQSLLDRTLGTGRSMVRVIVDLSFDQVERSAENHDSDRMAIRSVEVQAARRQEGGQNFSPSASSTSYAIPRSAEHVGPAFWTIERLSVAVMVDDAYVPPMDAAPHAPPTYQPRSTDQLQQIAAMVGTAVGFDSSRADRVEVVNMAFDRTAEEALAREQQSVQNHELYYTLGKDALYGVLILAALLLVRNILTQGRGALTGTASSQQAVPPPRSTSGVAADQPEHTQRLRASDVFGEQARGRPEEVAKIIKTMMSE